MTTRPSVTLRELFCLLAACSLMAVACDDDGITRPPPSGSDLGQYDMVDTSPSPSDGDMVIEVPGPVVTLEAPSPATDPATDPLVNSSRLTVNCRVSPNADGTRVDAESVTITVEDADGTVYTETARSSVSTTLFSAEFNLAEAPNGALSITCEASDRGTPVVTNSDTVETFLDLGPNITILTPERDTAYSQQLDVVFRVEPDPVAQGDTGAEVDESSIVAMIGNTTLPGITTDANGNYVLTVEFDDITLFDPPLDGPVLFRVEASNQRASGAVTRTAEVPFRADDTGPAITFVTPTAGQLVGGLFELRVKVTDPAGVDRNSVRATVAGTIMRDLEPIGNDEYSAQIDARGLNTDIVKATVNVRAVDNAGNEQLSGFTVSLDVHEPIVDLDSPLMRERFGNDGTSCSTLFDPLGTDTPNDLDMVPQQFELRARIEDLGNGSASTGTVGQKAGVAASTVRVYVVDDTTQGVTVDTDGDGVCDRINPNLEGAVVLDMVSVAPKGSTPGDFSVDDDAPLGTTPTVADDVCATVSQGTGNAICPLSSPLKRVIKDDIGTAPVIYTIPPVTNDNCVGSTFDALGTNIAEGWICVVARAEDGLGNLGVSAPIRLCVDYGSGICSNPGEAPDCTGSYDPMTGMDDPAADCAPAPDFAAYPERNLRRP